MTGDVHFGGIAWDERSSQLTTDLLVDNSCSKNCKEAFCTQVCDYSAPVAAEFKLEQYLGERWKVLDKWYQGGIAPPKWQGIMPGVPRKIFESQKPGGTRYRVSAKFADPTSLYPLTKESTTQFLLENYRTDPTKVGAEVLRPLEGLSGMPKTKLFPTLEPLLGYVVAAPAAQSSLSRALATLRSYLFFQSWPPYIEEFCDQEKDSCVNARKWSEPFVELEGEFKLENNQIRDVMLSRRSTILPNYRKINSQLPVVHCP
jgi:hypothetical protein